MAPENPYVGPRPFERQDALRFFGRERDTRDLASMIIAHRVVLLYSASGAGKSSLVNAGVVPLLEQKCFEVLPVGRVGVLVSETATNVFAGTLAAELGGRDGSIEAALQARERRLDEEDEPVPRILVIDQFEELFTAHPQHWSHRAGLFEGLHEALEADKQLRVLLVLREEYLAQLEPYGSSLPGSLKIRFRLERLDRDAALDAVTRPLEGTGRSFLPGVAENLVDDLLLLRVDTGSGESIEVPGEFVEPVHLQVVCSRLWTELPSDVTKIGYDDIEELADLDTVLARFYEDALEAARDVAGVSEKRLRRWVGDELITPGGTRSTVYRGRDETAGLPNKIVETLEDKRLVRAEQRAGALWYELTHDRLITPIRASDRRFATQLRRRRNRVLALLLPVALALAAAFGVAVGAAVVSGSSDEWSQVDPAAAELGGPGSQQLSDVTAVSGVADGVAVGRSGRRPAVWTHAGRRWSRDDLPGTGVIQAVAASGGTVVAVGSVDSGGAEGVNGMIWSRSGASWSRTCPDACAGTGKQEILAVAATSTGGFVAVGRVTVEGPSGGHFDAAVWLSDDGENWRPAADDEDLSGDQNQVMKGVVEIEGRLIAAGRSGIRGAVWTSDDGGSDWTIVASPALQSAQAFMELEAVTTFGSRVIAVGHEANHAAAWFSDDRGSEWTRATVLNTRFLDQQMIDVVGVPSGLVAVGSDEAHAAVWESADGSEWTAVSSDAFAGASGMLGIALVRGGMLFAVGTGRGDSLDPSMNGRIWVSEAGG